VPSAVLLAAWAALIFAIQTFASFATFCSKSNTNKQKIAKSAKSRQASKRRSRRRHSTRPAARLRGMAPIIGIAAVCGLLWSLGELAAALGMTITDGRISVASLFRLMTAVAIAIGSVVVLMNFPVAVH
jgi:hypothetical protein